MPGRGAQALRCLLAFAAVVLHVAVCAVAARDEADGAHIGLASPDGISGGCAAATRHSPPPPPPVPPVLPAACLRTRRRPAPTQSPCRCSPKPLRIWIDEFAFADGETVLLREAVAASSGSAVLAGDTRNRVLQLKSYQQATKLDVMWTGRPVGGRLGG